MLKLILRHLGTNFGEWAVEMEQNGVSLLKLEGAKVYLFYLTYVRRMVTLFYWTLFCTMLAALGLISLTISLVLLLTNIVNLPLELFFAEALFTIIPIVVLFALNSERAWLSHSGLSQLIQEAQSQMSFKEKTVASSDLSTIQSGGQIS